MRTWILGALLVACSSSSTGSGASGEATPSAAQTSATADTTNDTNTVAVSLTLADALAKFDPDLRPDGTAADNLTTIKANLATSQGGCAKVTASGDSGLSVDFGAGCTFNGVTVSGSLTVKVDVTLAPPKSVAVSLTLTNLVVNGWDIAGTANLSTVNGSTLTAKIDVTHAGKSLSFDGTVVGSPTSMTIDGTLGTATLTAVVIQKGACWPSAGTATTTVSGLSGTLTFDANTGTTGQASITYQTPAGATKPACYALPSYGTKCTATACAK
jgi:hypothetical protein